MPKKKITPAEEPEQTAAMTAEQAGEEAPAALGEMPQGAGAPDGSPPPEPGELDDAMSGDVPGLTGDGEGEAEEAMAVDVAAPPGPQDVVLEDGPPMGLLGMGRNPPPPGMCPWTP